MATFVRLVDFDSAEEKEHELQNVNRCYKIDQQMLENIPGQSIAYWLSRKAIEMLSGHIKINSYKLTAGIMTTDNARFMRTWPEVSISSIELNCRDIEYFSQQKTRKWFPFNKGGGQRKWWGLNDLIVNWENNGEEIKDQVVKNYPYLKGNYSFVIRGTELFFKGGLTWSALSSTAFSIRKSVFGAVMATKGPVLLAPVKDEIKILAFLNSCVALVLLRAIAPTLDFLAGPVGSLPIPQLEDSIEEIAIAKGLKNISMAKADWDLHEGSWEFHRSGLLTDYTAPCLEATIDENLIDWSWPSSFSENRTIRLAVQAESLKQFWSEVFKDLHRNEEDINSIFIELYNLKDELTSKIPYTEIMILQEELEDQAREEGRVSFNENSLAVQFVSYGIGCLMGRYSVEMDGLILAVAGATIDDFKAKIPSARFLPNQNAILPLTDEDDFPDDLPAAFKSWLRFISGAHYDDNLRWIEDRLGKDLRSFFDRDFYKDHIKRYKSRPIYWMVSSPSGAFRALIYLHRYTKDTVGKILNDYVRPYRTKLDQKVRGLESIIDSTGTSVVEKTKAKKRLTQLEKYRTEIETWEKESLYPLALKRDELDLDDGVKVNYRKLEGILEPVKQLEVKDEE